MKLIRKYNDFVNESNSDNSIGHWVDKEVMKNIDLLRIVNNYLKGVNPEIALSNAVNLLSEYDKKALVKEINDEISGNQEHNDVVATTDVINEDIQQEIEKVAISGKYTFNCFLYILTALKRDIEPNWKDCPEDYYIYWSSYGDKEELIELLSRYRSLEMCIQHIQQSTKNCGLFYGLSFSNNTVFLDYGVIVNSERILIGQFKVTDSALTSIVNKTNKSLSSFKRELKDTTIRIIKLFMIIKRELYSYKPSNYQERSAIQITKGVMSFGLYGIGKWDGVQIDKGEYDNLKQNFKTWLMKYNWSEKILVSINPQNYWVYFNIKIK